MSYHQVCNYFETAYRQIIPSEVALVKGQRGHIAMACCHFVQSNHEPADSALGHEALLERFTVF